MKEINTNDIDNTKIMQTDLKDEDFKDLSVSDEIKENTPVINNSKSYVLGILAVIILIIVGICVVLSQNNKDYTNAFKVVETDIQNWEKSSELNDFLMGITYITENASKENKTIMENDINALKAEWLKNNEYRINQDIYKNGNDIVIKVDFNTISYPAYMIEWINIFNEAEFDSFLPLEIDSTLNEEDIYNEALIKLENAKNVIFNKELEHETVTISYTLTYNKEQETWEIKEKNSSLPILTEETRTDFEELDLVYISAYIPNYDTVLNVEWGEEALLIWDEHIYNYCLEKYNIDLNSFIQGE